MIRTTTMNRMAILISLTLVAALLATTTSPPVVVDATATKTPQTNHHVDSSSNKQVAADFHEAVVQPIISTRRKRNVSPFLQQARRLDENGEAAAADEDDDNAYFQYDLSEFSIKFEKCQYVKMYDDDMAENEDYDSPLALKHFVIFRMCPTQYCGHCGTGTDTKYIDDTTGTISSTSTSSSTPIVYGKYTIDVTRYLEHTIQYQKRAFENMCENCGGNNDNNGDDNGDGQAACSEGDTECMECMNTCYNYENLENNGYIDAAEYTECQKLDVKFDENQNDGDGDDDGNYNDYSWWYNFWASQSSSNNQNAYNDDGQEEQQQEEDHQLYIGPRCNSKGKIVIGLFLDENCYEPISEDALDIEQVLGAKLSYHLLKQSYENTDTSKDSEINCISCMENDEDGNENDQEDADYVNEMCEDLYNDAAKCESETGLTSGFIQMNRDEQEENENNYENQVENEFLACTFIKSLIWNSYTETGEININEPQDEIIRVVTKKQIVALAGMSLVFAGLITLGAFFHTQIREIEANNRPTFVKRGDHTLI